RDAPRVDQGERERQRRLQTDYAKWGLRDRFGLEMRRMGSMIGGDRVDGSAGEAVAHRFKIAGGAQRRIHLRGSAVFEYGFFRQNEMMRRHFGSDVNAAASRGAHHLHRGSGRHMSS